MTISIDTGVVLVDFEELTVDNEYVTELSEVTTDLGGGKIKAIYGVIEHRSKGGNDSRGESSVKVLIREVVPFTRYHVLLEKLLD